MTCSLSGRCDVVEFHPDGTIYPVEYKHGKKKKWLNDDVQLVAQAICLQEMDGAAITSGAIFHIQSRRRREVAITAELINLVTEITRKVRELPGQQTLPAPTDQVQRCDGCSMFDTCVPQLSRARQRIHRMGQALFRVDNEFQT